MIVDLDHWLADEQESVAEGRVFPHDMFLSHRRFDLPTGLVDSLSARGANIVWDCDLDMRDRRVMQGVAHAMRRSRFVALFVSERYVDSPWCRAEYLNALWVEEKFSISRALVICESEAAMSRVPESLRGVRRFVLTGEAERELAEFVMSGNSVDENETATALRRRVPAERLAQNVDLLSLDEQLNLLEQRTLFWGERGTAGIKASKKEQAVVRLTELMSDPLTEVEVIFREVSSLVFESRASERRRPSIGPQELRRVVNMARSVADGYSQPSRAAEIIGLDKWAYDFVLKPLLLAVELGNTRSEAASVYRALCSALKLGAFGHEVPVYLSVLEAVESQRQDIASAVSNHRLKLYEAGKGRDSGA
jgi:hypothetical protein